MTLVEMLNDVEQKVNAYNAEKLSDTSDIVKVTALRKELDEAVEKAVQTKTDMVYAGLMGAINPMVEACRQYEFTVVAITDVKDKTNGELVGVQLSERTMRINPTLVTDKVMQASVQKGTTIPKNGVATNGKAWIYGLERLGNMLAYRNVKDLGGSEARLKQVCDDYFISEAAAKEKNGEKPTSNTKLIDAVQAIVDKMVFVPNKFGQNAIKVLTPDVKFLLDNIARHGKGAGTMKQNRERILQGLLFEVCHLIVCDKPYTYEFRMKKDAVLVAQPSRNPKSLVAHPIIIDLEGKLIQDEVSEPTPVEKPKAKRAAKKADKTDTPAEVPATDTVEQVEKTA